MNDEVCDKKGDARLRGHDTNNGERLLNHFVKKAKMFFFLRSELDKVQKCILLKKRVRRGPNLYLDTETSFRQDRITTSFDEQ